MKSLVIYETVYRLWGGIYNEPINILSLSPDKISFATSAIITPKKKGFTKLVKLSFALNSSVSEDDLENQVVQLFKYLDLESL